MSDQSTNNVTMRQYETLYILRPELDEDTSCGFMRKMKEWVEEQGGKSVQVLCWGRKKLVWPRKDMRKGFYVQHTYVGKPNTVAAYERQLDVDERVLLRQTITLKHEVDPEKVQPLPDQFAPMKDPADTAAKSTEKAENKAFKRNDQEINNEE
ncbi:MAG: 30S ribosomal protein S6 [Myxococcota bacterium]